MKTTEKIDLVLVILSSVCLVIIGYGLFGKTERHTTNAKPFAGQVFNMMSEDFNKLKNGSGDKTDLQYRLNAESGYLIGYPREIK